MLAGHGLPPLAASALTKGDDRSESGTRLAPAALPDALLPGGTQVGRSPRHVLGTALRQGWVQPHQNPVSKTSFLLLSGIFSWLSWETTTVT